VNPASVMVDVTDANHGENRRNVAKDSSNNWVMMSNTGSEAGERVASSRGVVVPLIGAGPWLVGAKWGGISDFLSDFGSFCVRPMSAAFLVGFLAFQHNRVGTDESSMPMRVTRFSIS
jgi:hypothetical protein